MAASPVSSNLWKIPLIRAMRSFMLIMPILVLFYKESGLTLTKVFLLQSLFSVVVIVLEVPTGYLADLFGRKSSLVFGSILCAVGFTTYSASYGFWGFLLSEVLIGFGVSFMSGADSAILYESLKELGRSEEYKKSEGRNLSYGMASEAVASILGGIIAVASLRFPMYAEAVVTWLVVPLSLSLVEPTRKRLVSKENPLSGMLRLTRYALHEHTELKWLTIYSSVVGASTLTMVWFAQPYLKEAGLPIGYFGVAWAVLMLIGSFFSWHAHGIESFLGKRRALHLLVALPVIGYFWLGLSGSLLGSFAIGLFYIVRGIHSPVLSDYINGLVGSDIRASILSIKNLVGRLIFSVIGPFVGWVADGYSLSAALLVSGTIFLSFGTVALFGLFRTDRR